MKKILPFLLLAAIFSFPSCRNNGVKVKDISTEDQAANTMAQKNRQTTMNLLEAINRHDINAILKDCAPDMQDYGDESGRPLDVEGVKNMLSSWFTAFPDYQVEDARIVSDGEWVMAWGQWKGTWKGDYMNQKPTGKPFKINDVDIFRYNEKGQLTEHHNITPFSAIAQQAGIKMQ